MGIYTAKKEHRQGYARHDWEAPDDRAAATFMYTFTERWETNGKSSDLADVSYKYICSIVEATKL